MGGGARKRERSKAWAGKKQEKEAKLKAMERECGIRGAAKRNCDRDLFWAGVALEFARMGVGLGTHPGLGQTPHGSDIRVRASGGGDRTIGGSGKRRSLWPRGSVAQFLPKETEKAEDRNHDMAMEVQKVLDYLRHEESCAAETQAVEPTRWDLGASHSAHHQGFRLGDRRRHKRVCASDAGPPSARSTLSSHKKSAKSRLGGAS